MSKITAQVEEFVECSPEINGAKWVLRIILVIVGLPMLFLTVVSIGGMFTGPDQIFFRSTPTTHTPPPVVTYETMTHPAVIPQQIEIAGASAPCPYCFGRGWRTYNPLFDGSGVEYQCADCKKSFTK